MIAFFKGVIKIIGYISFNSADPACATNKNGVTRQCAKHKPLATIPKVSELRRMRDKFTTVKCILFKEAKILLFYKCNFVALIIFIYF